MTGIIDQDANNINYHLHYYLREIMMLLYKNSWLLNGIGTNGIKSAE